ncbi:MAG: hypothetical protein R3183_01635 [Oleiphilaceae bacterium]|nr:hypothetical protein [Oleiphilaceae bacterium]
MSKPHLVVVVLCVLTLSSCRYWSMLRFAQQLCEPQEYLQLATINAQTALTLHQPVLPEAVFMRYFMAHPIHQSPLPEHLEEYQFVLVPETSPEAMQYPFAAHFSTAPGSLLLAGGTLGPELSEVFSQDFAEPILYALCSESPDIGLKEIKVPMQLNMPPNALASYDAIAALFPNAERKPLEAGVELAIRLDFLHRDAGIPSLQGHPVDLRFGFESGQWRTLHVNYDRYSVWLDFSMQRGLFHAIRR